VKKSKRIQRLLFIVDPWDTLDHERDTTLRLAEEAIEMGFRCALSENRTIGLDHRIPHGETREIVGFRRPRRPGNIQLGEVQWEPLAGFDHIFYRTDPPVDLSYLLPLQILAAARGARGKPQIHAAPESLFFLNEKWAAAELGELFPESLVSASIDRLTGFVTSHGKVVLKPLYLAQSKGVEILDTHSFSLGTIRDRLRLSTDGEKIPVIVQEFLPGISAGETRLWFVDGKLLATVKKIPKSGESIIDMDRGGKLAKTKLSTRNAKGAKKIGVFLRKHHILFAAVDLIDGKITDFNHTSPGLLVAMEELLGENLARRALRTLS